MSRPFYNLSIIKIENEDVFIDGLPKKGKITWVAKTHYK